MAKFLVDENLSPAIAFYLRKWGFEAKSVRELNLTGEPDKVILDFAQTEGWIIVTGDIEFGKFFYEKLGKFSVIVIRSHSQSSGAVLKILERLNQENILKQLPPNHYLILATASITRIRKYEPSL